MHVDETVFVAQSYEEIQRAHAPATGVVDAARVCATLCSQTSIECIVSTLFDDAADRDGARACLTGAPGGNMSLAVETAMVDLPLVDVDTVASDDLCRCIPVRGTECVVVAPTTAKRFEKVTVVVTRTGSAHHASAIGRIVLRRTDGKVNVGVFGISGARKSLTLNNTDAWRRVFESEDAIEPTDAADAPVDDGVRPAMVKRIGEFLQAKLHANVVGLACARDATRTLPMAIESVQVREHRAENPSFNGVWVHVKLHASTCKCACGLWPSTRHAGASSSHVEFRMRMCAKRLCIRSNSDFEPCNRPNHSSAATALEVGERQRRLKNTFGRCIAGKAIDLVCVHQSNGKRGRCARETPLRIDKLLSCLDTDGLKHFEALMGALAEGSDFQDLASATNLKRKRCGMTSGAGAKDRLVAEMLRGGHVEVRCARSTGRFVGTRCTKRSVTGTSVGDAVKIESVYHPYLPRVVN